MSTTSGRPDDADLPVEPPANVLCRAPSLSDGEMEVCSTVGDHRESNLLLVSLSGGLGQRLESWKRHGGMPSRVAVVSAEQTRGAVAADGGAGPSGIAGATAPDGETSMSTTTVSGPGDLTGLGIKLSQCLSAWTDDEAPTHVCFDSVTTLLQYVEVRQAFRFLDVTTKRVRNAGAIAHYHVDPGAHDEQTLATLESAFSNRIEYDPETMTWSPA